jgi:hypothetical protein
MNLRAGQNSLPTNSLKVSLGCDVGSRDASNGDCRRQTDINFLGGTRPIAIGRIPTEGSFSCLMLVIGKRFRFCHSAG